MTYILPGMLSDPYQIIMRGSLLMLQHACEWGRALLCFAGEPLAPVLQDGSPMHRAIRNYALDPNHVLHGEVDFDEDDDDDDEYDDDDADEQSLGQTTSLHFSFPTRVRVVPHSQRSPEPGRPADPNHTTIHHPQDPVENQISQEINSRTISSPVPEASDSLVDYDSDFWKWNFMAWTRKNKFIIYPWFVVSFFFGGVNEVGGFQTICKPQLNCVLDIQVDAISSRHEEVKSWDRFFFFFWSKQTPCNISC